MPDSPLIVPVVTFVLSALTYLVQRRAKKGRGYTTDEFRAVNHALTDQLAARLDSIEFRIERIENVLMSNRPDTKPLKGENQ